MKLVVGANSLVIGNRECAAPTSRLDRDYLPNSQLSLVNTESYTRLELKGHAGALCCRGPRGIACAYAEIIDHDEQHSPDHQTAWTPSVCANWECRMA